MPAETVRKFTKGDTLVSLYAQLMDGSGNAVNLTGQTVVFNMVTTSDGTSKVSAASVTIITAATGEVRYDWAPADVDTADEYWGWFVRTSGGKTAHHPGQGHLLKIVIVAAES